MINDSIPSKEKKKTSANVKKKILLLIHDMREKKELIHSSTEKEDLENNSDSISHGKVSKVQ